MGSVKRRIRLVGHRFLFVRPCSYFLLFYAPCPSFHAPPIVDRGGRGNLALPCHDSLINDSESNGPAWSILLLISPGESYSRAVRERGGGVGWGGFVCVSWCWHADCITDAWRVGSYDDDYGVLHSWSGPQKAEDNVKIHFLRCMHNHTTLDGDWVTTTDYCN